MREEKEMPLGLAFQLSMNEKAMENFARMTDAEKQSVLNAAKNVESKEEMRQIVSDLSK